MQGVEIRHPVEAKPDNLSVEDCRSVEACCRLGHERIAFRPVCTIDGEETNPTISDMDLQPIAVMFQLMRPARAGWRLLGDDWLTRMDESSRRRIEWPAARVTPQHGVDIAAMASKRKTYPKNRRHLRNSSRRFVLFHFRKRTLAERTSAQALFRLCKIQSRWAKVQFFLRVTKALISQRVPNARLKPTPTIWEECYVK